MTHEEVILERLTNIIDNQKEIKGTLVEHERDLDDLKTFKTKVETGISILKWLLSGSIAVGLLNIIFTLATMIP